MTTLDGFFLPGLDESAVIEWGYLETSGLRVRYPMLSADQVEAVWRTILGHRNRMLINTPVARIVTAVDAAAHKLYLQRDEATRLVAFATGYSQAVVAETLANMLADWSAASLHTMLAAELGDARVLDQPLPVAHIAGKRSAAFGFDRTFQVFSGNVPGVAVTSLIRSLLVKSATLGKTASGEPVLPALFARALHDVAPDIASCLAVTYWPRDATEIQRVALRDADSIVVYGSAEAVAAVTQAAGANKHVVIHGPRLSFGIVGPDSTDKTPRDVARAVAAYDQQGCVSPHVVYVIGDPARARAFARDVAMQLKAINVDLPRGVVSAEEAVAIRNARTAAEFADDAELFGEENGGFSVIYEGSPDFKLSCLNRVLFVKPLPGPLEVIPLLPRADLLQSAGVEGLPDETKDKLARALGLCGVSRITSFERLPWPPMHWHHDGSSPLRELLRWQDIEA